MKNKVSIITDVKLRYDGVRTYFSCTLENEDIVNITRCTLERLPHPAVIKLRGKKRCLSRNAIERLDVVVLGATVEYQMLAVLEIKTVAYNLGLKIAR